MLQFFSLPKASVPWVASGDWLAAGQRGDGGSRVAAADKLDTRPLLTRQLHGCACVPARSQSSVAFNMEAIVQPAQGFFPPIYKDLFSS